MGSSLPSETNSLLLEDELEEQMEFDGALLKELLDDQDDHDERASHMDRFMEAANEKNTLYDSYDGGGRTELMGALHNHGFCFDHEMTEMALTLPFDYDEMDMNVWCMEDGMDMVSSLNEIAYIYLWEDYNTPT